MGSSKFNLGIWGRGVGEGTTVHKHLIQEKGQYSWSLQAAETGDRCWPDGPLDLVYLTTYFTYNLIIELRNQLLLSRGKGRFGLEELQKMIKCHLKKQ